MSKIRERVQEQKASRSHMEERQALPPMPKSMLVELTNGCNHACLFCANPHMQRQVGRIDSDLLFRVMAEARAAGVEEIGLYTTGEPFVHKDLAGFTAKAHDLGFGYIFVTTNGALATPDRSKAVIDAGLNSIKFSINAGSRETYLTIHGRDDWDQVMANLRFIAEYRRTLDRPLALAVSFIVTDVTKAETEAFKAMVEPLVDDVIFLDCVTQMGQSELAQSMLSPTPQTAATGICHLPFNRLHVTCEGYLTLCCTDYHNYLVVADLKAMSLAEAWHCDAFVKARRMHIEQRLDGTMCGRCWTGDKSEMKPLLPEFATKLDPEAFQRSAADALKRRLPDRS